MGWSNTDLEFMRAALVEARNAGLSDEIPVGAVVVYAGKVIGRGHNRTIIDNDPSAHAEIVALRAAGDALGRHRLLDAIVYVTLEPCAMCMGALSQARVSRLAFGAYDDKFGAAGSAIDLSASSALNHRFEVNGGVLAEDCSALLQNFFADKR